MPQTRRTFFRASVSALLTLSVGRAAAQAPAKAKKKSAVLAAAPRDSRVKFDTDLVRVILADVQPGQKSALHRHDVNRVMVYLDDGAQRLRFADGTVKDQTWKAGDVLWDPANGLHTSENISGKRFRIAEIELKKPKGDTIAWPELDPPKVDPNHYRVLLENDQVRVLRIRFGAGDMAPLHEHILPRVVVFLTDYRLRMTSPDGEVRETEGEAGEITMPGPAKHMEKSLSGRLTEIIAVELKFKP